MVLTGSNIQNIILDAIRRHRVVSEKRLDFCLTWLVSYKEKSTSFLIAIRTRKNEVFSFVKRKIKLFYSFTKSLCLNF